MKKVFRYKKDMTGIITMSAILFFPVILIAAWVMVPITWINDGFNPWMLFMILVFFGQILFLQSFINRLRYKVIITDDYMSGNKIIRLPFFGRLKRGYEQLNLQNVVNATVKQDKLTEGYIEILFNLDNGQTKKIDISYSRPAQQKEIFEILSKKIHVELCSKLPIHIKQKLGG